jgi:hypothetical protein
VARLASFLPKVLTTRWAVGAVALIIDEEIDPPEVLLDFPVARWNRALETRCSPQRRSHATTSSSPASGARFSRSWELKSTSSDWPRSTRFLYVPEEPGPYRLDFYYRCLPKQGFSSLRDGLGSGSIKPRSPEVRQIVLVPFSRLKEYDLYSSDARILFPLVT